MAESDPQLRLMSVPDVLMDKLTCVKCNNILSVYPVYSQPDGTAVCGRCIDLANPEGMRNNIYETLSEFLMFPCMNKQYGCMENCTGHSMQNHEMKCPFRRINCPTIATTSCEWIGEIDNLLEHFEDNHARNLLKEPSFEVDFVHNFEEIYLLPYSDSLFLVKNHGDIQAKLFWCSVQTIFTNECEKYQFFITLKNPSNGESVELSKRMADNLNDLDGLEINSTDIQKTLKNPSTVIAAIDIIEFETPIIKPKIVTDYLSEKNLEMLKIIECPVCFDYMVPPIFQCSGGHSICGECKNKIQQCPTCEKSFGETQNYAVESFTSLLKYPCKNSERGCEYLSPAKEIRQHEKMCIFGCYRCPTVDYTFCQWSGTSQDVWNHCKNNHIDNIMESSLMSMPFESGDEEQEDDDCMILKFLKYVFILHWEYNKDSKTFHWALQLVGPPEESENYCFDLDVIDRSGRNMRIYVRTPCGPYTSKNSAFNNDKCAVCLTYDQVKYLINEVFCFKITIHKNQQ